MKKFSFIVSYILAFLVFGTFISVNAQQSIPSKQQQIEAAISPAPRGMRDDATVYGYNDKGQLITLREGSNELICVADDPGRSKFHAACYHKDLEPFMKRGRELRAQGLSRTEVDSIRQQEIRSGELSMPRKPMSLYSLSGPEGGFNYGTGEVVDAEPLYVIYIPFATRETTGLSTSPASKGAPWIMEPGKPWAHIMVIPGTNLGKGNN